ncbi:MAG: hypothetical protein GWP91_18955 [Rhodobacterales bacterium]|nr:hypothetical protein [Rhodobacterales bacterium]
MIGRLCFSALLLSLMACGEEPVVAFSCDYAFQYPEGIDEGEFETGTLDCETYESSGDQLLITLEAGCEADGIARGADTTECFCEYDAGQADCNDFLSNE